MRLLVWCTIILLGLSPASAYGQSKCPPPSAPHISNYRVVDEHTDKEGNTTKIVEYEENGRHKRETMILRNIRPNLTRPINPDTLNKDSVVLVVIKSRFALEVWYRRKLVRSYKAVFGSTPMENKNMEGDRRTPEGWFTIQNLNPNSRYDKFLLLSYPNDSSLERFNKLKQHGIIPSSARPGGDVGIHGIWKGGDDMIEKGICWTDGCVAITNKDVDELFRFVTVGTRVLIKK